MKYLGKITDNKDLVTKEYVDNAVAGGGGGGVTGVKGNSESSYRTGDVNITAANVGAVPTSRTVNSKALSSDITLSASDVGAVSTSDKYTRSSAGHLDWSNQTDGDAKVIAKSALAYWNGRYNANASNLAYCSKGAFGDLAVKNSLAASDVGAVPTTRKVNGKALSSDITLKATDLFIFDTYSKNITVPGQGAYNFTISALTQRSGYTLIGYINKDGGYTDQWLISYGTYGSNIVAMVYSKYGASLSKTVSCTAIWIKN